MAVPISRIRRRGRRPKLSQSEELRLTEMYDAGNPITEIMAEFGVSKQAVYDITKRNKKSPSDQTEAPTLEDANATSPEQL